MPVEFLATNNNAYLGKKNSNCGSTKSVQHSMSVTCIIGENVYNLTYPLINITFTITL